MAERIAEKAQSTTPIETVYKELRELLHVDEATTEELFEAATMLLKEGD
jgi:hypothetical protein